MALEWDNMAESAIGGVPWFVRKRARLAVERRVEEEGRTMVTDADAAAVREETMARLLGRLPTSVEAGSLEASVALTGRLVALWEREGRPGERVGQLLDRLIAEGSSLTGLLVCCPQAVRR